MTPADHHKRATALATYRVLDRFAADDYDAAKWAAHCWAQDNSHGQPAISMMQEEARSDALFWAETASPMELECYLLAASRKLAENGSMMHTRHIKRLIAGLWGCMNAGEQGAFLAWIEHKKGNGNDAGK